MTFNEANVKRSADGKFGEKLGSAPETELRGRELYVPPRDEDPFDMATRKARLGAPGTDEADPDFHMNKHSLYLAATDQPDDDYDDVIVKSVRDYRTVEEMAAAGRDFAVQAELAAATAARRPEEAQLFLRRADKYRHLAGVVDEIVKTGTAPTPVP